MKTIERPMTLEEFDALPESNRPAQLIEGHLVAAPAPDRFHQRLSGAIYVAVYLHLEAHPDRGEVYQAPFEVQFPGVNVYQPDVMFFTRAHLGRLTDKRAVGAPDLVVEILSPSTARYDTGKKREVYARFGVAELWIVDPPRRSVSVYGLGQDPDQPLRVLKHSDVLRTALLPGFELPLSRVFGREH
ncbi:MAG: Uma2 family endonuclease [Verrucomicrobia bacterium]|nr:Uma2 family endonuclease [Verrucomicrobiota bacterium]